MSKHSFVLTTALVAAFCGLNQVQGQQTVPGQPGDVVQPQQPDTPTLGSPIDQADRYEARRVSIDDAEQGPTVREAILQKLEKSNLAEIELAKLAMQKSDNQEVKQLAQTIVQDHQACNTKLQQLSSHNAASHAQTAQKNQDSRPDQGSRTDQATRNEQGNRTAQATRTERTNRDEPNAQRGQNASMQQTVPRQLCQIQEQACDNALKMTKEMLSKYEGQDFDMAFLGQQCVAHTMLLAELKAIESTGPEELQPFAQEAISKVQQHLESAKQLAKKFEDDRKQKRNS